MNDDNDLIRRGDALKAVQLGDTVTKLQARIAAVPAVRVKPEAVERAIEMLRIAATVIREHAYSTEAEYDGTTCDGYCIADDCGSAAEDLDTPAPTPAPKPVIDNDSPLRRHAKAEYPQPAPTLAEVFSDLASRQQRLGPDAARIIYADLESMYEPAQPTTDDLVKRLRDEHLAMTRTEAADRIEQLERERDGARKANREMVLEVLAASGQAQEAYEAQLAAEATVTTRTAQMEALMKAAKKVVTSFWQSTDGTISGMYELERALAAMEASNG
jgi:hypothetical protein